MENAECNAQIRGTSSRSDFEAAKHQLIQSWMHPIEDIKKDWNSNVQSTREMGQETKELPKQFADAYQLVQKELSMTPQQSHAQFMHALKIMKTVDEKMLKGLVAFALHEYPDDKCSVDILKL